MKNKLLLLCLLLATFVQTNSFAQWTYSVTQTIDGGNPGNVNTTSDSDQSGWTDLISGSAASNSWSAPYLLPFAFDFYGSPVTAAIISGNGVLSFDTLATAIPADANTTLPAAATANIPDSSILGFWDSFSAGAPVNSNDVVAVNVFGSAPNRQVWFRYFSYEYGDNGSGAAQASFAYWAIVLEETTNKIYVVDMSFQSGGTGLTSTIGVQLNSTTAVEFGSGSNAMTAGSSPFTDNDIYEFTPVLLVDDNAAVASVDAPVSPLSTGIQNVDITLENAGLNSLTSATIDWEVNGVAQTTSNWTGSLASNATATVNLGTFNFQPGTSTIKVWTSLPNGLADGDPSNDTLEVSLCTSLNGTYTVGGAGADYADILAAVADVNSCGVSGPVTFNIAAGTYTGAATLNENIAGLSAANTITFNGADAATTIMTYDGAGTENATFTLDGADYITIKNLTVENTESTSNGWGIHLTNTADFNTIDSCIVTVNNTSTSSTFVGILGSGSLTSTATNGNNVNNLTISNTTVNGGYYGVRLWGGSTAVVDNLENTIENCSFVDAYFYPIYLYYQGLSIVTGNSAFGLRNTTSGYGFYGNYLTQPIVTKNEFHGGRTYGLAFFNVNTSLQTFTQEALIANNMISTLGSGEGIYLSGSDSVNVYHNSVSSENERALWVTTTSNFYDIKNNIFVTQGGTVIDIDADPSADDEIDYNIYHSTSGGDVAIIGTTTHTTLADWVVADAANNANSLSGDPTFLGATDLRLGGTLANNVGLVISSIVDDIDGDSRSATTPDIGADEYAPPTCFQPSAQSVTAITSSSADLGWTPSGTETEWDYEYDVAGFAQGSGTLVTATTSNPSNISGLMPNTTYEFYVRANCGGTDFSTWAGPFSFTTACVAFTAPYTESFDVDATPACWSQSAVTGGPWEFGPGVNTSCAPIADHTGNGGFFAWMDQSLTDAEVVLEMNDVDVTSLTTPYLEFYYSECGNVTLQNFLYIEAWDGSAWTNVGTLNQSTNGWEFFGFDLTTHTYGANLVRIRFRAESGGDGSDFNADNVLDDVSILEAPTCFVPSNLNVTNLLANTADLGWTANTGETEWAVEWGVAGFAQGAGTLVPSTTTNPESISGLMAESDYEFYVRSICGIGDSSNWTGPFGFTTPCAVVIPNYLQEFGTYVPDCWEEFQGVLGATGTTVTDASSSQWIADGFANNGTTGAARMEIWSIGRDEWLISPSIDLGTAPSPYYLRFDLALTTWNNTNADVLGADDTLAVVISTDNGVTWSQANILEQWDATTTVSNTGQLVSIDLSAYSGIVKFGFYAASSVSGGDVNVYIDNFSIAPCVHTTDTIAVTACDSYTSPSGLVVTTTGTFNDTIVNSVGCDSIINITLTINNSVTGTDVQTACASYTWIDGTTYTADNNSATFTLTNAAGCDSVVTLDLTILPLASGTDVQTACDSYIWIDGNTYTTNNNTAMFTIAGGAANGCDSIVTLDLTINNSNSGVDVVNACGSYTWIDGNTYTNSTSTPTFTDVNAAGCDSVITLLLTINQASSSVATITACGSYTWIDGVTYTASNNSTTYTLPNSNGCDSIITLNLTINDAVTNTVTVTECDSYTSDAGNTYTSTGVYTEMFMAANGCDSVLTLDVTITGTDASVTQTSGVFLFSNQAGATYQWLDCDNGNAPIAGETDQLFVAEDNGNYACEVTFQNCTVTSTCITVNNVGIEDASAIFANIFPNPATDQITITLSDFNNTQFELMDMQGKIVMAPTNIVSGQTIDVSNLRSGIYFVRLTSDDNTMIKRVVKN